LLSEDDADLAFGLFFGCSPANSSRWLSGSSAALKSFDLPMTDQWDTSLGGDYLCLRSVWKGRFSPMRFHIGDEIRCCPQTNEVAVDGIKYLPQRS